MVTTHPQVNGMLFRTIDEDGTVFEGDQIAMIVDGADERAFELRGYWSDHYNGGSSSSIPRLTCDVYGRVHCASTSPVGALEHGITTWQEFCENGFALNFDNCNLDHYGVETLSDLEMMPCFREVGG